MKVLYFLSMAIVSAALISCAGTPEPSAAPATEEVEPREETAAQAVEAPEIQIETVWKPETTVYTYVDGTVDKTVNYSYDDMGRELLIEEYDGQGNLQSSNRFSYSQGILQKQETYSGETLISETIYEVDENGRLTKAEKMDPEGNILSVVTNTYEGDRLISSTAYDADEIPSLITVYNYQDGILLGIEYQLPDGSLDARLEKNYENGVLLKEQVLLSDGTVESSRSFEYENGLLSGETQYAGTMKIKSVKYEYDGNGNIIKETWSDNSGNEYEIIEHSWISFEIEK